MKIILYRLDCDANELNKNKYISDVSTSTITIEGTLREECSITTPSIAFAKKITSLTLYNYAYISDFNRYYFITEITSIKDGLTRIDLKCDVLYSFRYNIVSSSSLLFVERWSGSDNKLIDDNLRDYEVSNLITEVRADTLTTSGVTLDNWESDLYVDLSYHYALNVVSTYGYGSSAGDIIIPPFLKNIVPNIYPLYYNGNDYVTTFACDKLYITYLLNNWISQRDDVANAIISIDVYPFKLEQTIQQESIRIGSVDITSMAPYPYITKPSVQLLADFTPITSSETKDYNTYKTKYELWLPFDKWVTLDVNEIINTRVLVFYVPNYIFKQCNIYVITALGKLLYTNTVSICNSVPINSSNAQQIRDNYIQSIISASTGLISSTLGATTGNAYAMAKGVGDIAGSAIKLVTQPFTTHLTISATNPNGNSGITSARHVIFRKTRPVPVVSEDTEEWDNYTLNFGLPYMQTINGSDLEMSDRRGTYYFGECKINFSDATKGEIDEVKSILKQGIKVT